MAYPVAPTHGLTEFNPKFSRKARQVYQEDTSQLCPSHDCQIIIEKLFYGHYNTIQPSLQDQ